MKLTHQVIQTMGWFWTILKITNKSALLWLSRYTVITIRDDKCLKQNIKRSDKVWRTKNESGFFNQLEQACSFIKLCFEMKMTKLGVGHFTSISGHLFTNCNNSFHKTVVLTVILKDPTCQNLDWIKSYDINYKMFFPFIFSFVRKNLKSYNL